MPRQIFRNLRIATAGPLPGQLSTDNLRQWTKIRKGTFTEDFDEEVTHLLCTREQFNKKVTRVKDALARGKRCHIVHFDWFEVSAVNEKKQPEREYSMRSMLAKQNAAKREQARIERGRREGERAVNTNLYRIYHDRTFFPYQIDLTRDDESTGEIGQRYTLYLWESNAKPHLYWFTVKFMKKKGNSQPSYYRPSPCSGLWRHEMDLFMDFFRIKTGIDWQDRVLKQQTMSASYFQYSPPTGGKPVGRRLRFCYDYCLEVNAGLRGLPWPPAEDTTEGKFAAGACASASPTRETHIHESTPEISSYMLSLPTEDNNPAEPLTEKAAVDAKATLPRSLGECLDENAFIEGGGPEYGQISDEDTTRSSIKSREVIHPQAKDEDQPQETVTEVDRGVDCKTPTK